MGGKTKNEQRGKNTLYKNLTNTSNMKKSRGVHCTKHVRVYVSAEKGYILNVAVFRIYTINTFKTENYSRILGGF